MASGKPKWFLIWTYVAHCYLSAPILHKSSARTVSDALCDAITHGVRVYIICIILHSDAGPKTVKWWLHMAFRNGNFLGGHARSQSRQEPRQKKYDYGSAVGRVVVKGEPFLGRIYKLDYNPSNWRRLTYIQSATVTLLRIRL